MPAFLASTVDEISAALAAAEGPIRPAGAGTRRDWGGPDPGPVTDLSLLGLNRIVEHNPGDLTAVLQAGVRLRDAQATFALAGQWLALDPPDLDQRDLDQRGLDQRGLDQRDLDQRGLDQRGLGGTIGGLFATADSGPARHRYGGARDLIIGATIALSDGTVASSGGRVIKNVAGYDLSKLITGSFGTLGVILSVSVRLHPLPPTTATVALPATDPDVLGQHAVRLARAPIEAMCLDAWWRADDGGLLVRFAGVAALEQAHRVAATLPGAAVAADDRALWDRQRAGQRCADGVVLKVSALPTDLPRIIAAARANGASLVSRAGLGLSWLALQPSSAANPHDPADQHDVAARVAAIRAAVAPRTVTALDGAARVDNPGPTDPAVRMLTERVKARFDPARRLRPGALGGL